MASSSTRCATISASTRAALALPPEAEMTTIDPKTFLTSIFDAAVAAADPERTIRNHLPAKPKGRTIVIGAGKGSAQMAAAFEKAWDGPIEGLVVTRYGYGATCERIEIIEAAHPVPDAAGLDASRAAARQGAGLTADDLVVALISGGGSALLPSPAGGLTLADEIAVNEALLASGAPIAAMNTIRKHVSTIKGGRLAAAAYPARVVSLVVSDIPGDNPALVASGPTIPDAGSRADALASIAAYGMKLPAAVMAHLNSPSADAPQPDDPRFAAQRSASHRLGRRLAGSRRGGSEAAGHRSGDPVRFDRGRGARGRRGPCRDRARGRDAQPAIPEAGADPVRRRNHGDAARTRARAAATANSCSPSRSASTASTASMRWPPTRTASTARKTMPAPLPTARPCRACARPASTPRPCSPATMPGRRSMRSATCSCRDRPARMSTISGRS